MSELIKDYIILDGFYTNPEEVRDYALSLPFWVKGNYPGLRTNPAEPWASDNLKNHMQNIIASKGLKITNWGDGYNTAYQYTLETCGSWIHHDSNNSWACVVYLTPDAPKEAGTTFYRHKETGIYEHKRKQPDFNEEYQSPDKWEEIFRVDNVFNRAIIYRGNYYHRSAPEGFGTNKWNGRLFQTFFFDAE